jgi:polyhydroxybutyrate depolymerase
MEAMSQQIGQHYRVDPTRIYGNGFSNGGILIQRIPCEVPQMFAAVAVMAGALMTSSCYLAAGVPFLIIHGREDARIPWDGGTVNSIYRMSMGELVRTVSGHNQCQGFAETVSEQSGPAICLPHAPKLRPQRGNLLWHSGRWAPMGRWRNRLACAARQEHGSVQRQ